MVALHCLANPAKYQHNNRDEYCNIFVNLSRPSNVKTQVIQFLICTGDFLLEMPVCRMDRCDGLWCILMFMSSLLRTAAATAGWDGDRFGRLPLESAPMVGDEGLLPPALNDKGDDPDWPPLTFMLLMIRFRRGTPIAILSSHLNDAMSSGQQLSSITPNAEDVRSIACNSRLLPKTKRMLMMVTPIATALSLTPPLPSPSSRRHCLYVGVGCWCWSWLEIDGIKTSRQKVMQRVIARSRVVVLPPNPCHV